MMDLKDYYSDYYYGLTMYARKLYQRALFAFENSIKKYPNHFQSWYYRGHTLCNLGKYPEAVISFNQSIKINPNDPKTWLFRGEVLAKLGKITESNESFNTSMKINPKVGYSLISEIDNEWYSMENIEQIRFPFSFIASMKRLLPNQKLV